MFKEVLNECIGIQNSLNTQAKLTTIKFQQNYIACNYQINTIKELYEKGGINALYEAGYSSKGKDIETGAAIALIGKIESLEMAITGNFGSYHKDVLYKKFNL